MMSRRVNAARRGPICRAIVLVTMLAVTSFGVAIDSVATALDPPVFTPVAPTGLLDRPGGSPGSAACPAGTVMNGVAAYSRTDGSQQIRVIVARCQQVVATANGLALDGTTVTSGDLGNRLLNSGVLPPVTYDCPARSAVTGVSADAGGSIDRVSVRCSAFGADGTVQPPVAVQGPFIGGPSSGVTRLGPVDCVSSFASGVYGRAGDDINAVGLLCATITVAPPPTLAVSIRSNESSPKVGVGSVRLADLPATAFQGYGGTTSDYSTSSLQTLDLRADLGAPNAAKTPVAAVTLAQLGLDRTPITQRLLSTILLPEISIAGGWSRALRPATNELLVEQTISLGDVYKESAANGRYPGATGRIKLGDLGLEASNLGSISTYAALLAGVSVTQLPFPAGARSALAYWCAQATKVGLDCSRDFGADVVTGAGGVNLTLPVLSFAGIDVEQADLLGTPLVRPSADGSDSVVDLSGTPIGQQPLGQLNLGLVPLASQPLVPSKSLPSFIPVTPTIPTILRNVTLGELAGATPLGALIPADVGLSGALLSTGGRAVPVRERAVDLDFRAVSPLSDYQWAPPAPGASLLLSSDAPLSNAVSNVTVKSLGADAPLLAVPLDQLTLRNGREFGDIKLSELLASTAPFGASPFGASPFGASPFGASPFGASPFGASPFGASPFGASPFGASPFGASPFGASKLSELGLAAPVVAIPLVGLVDAKALGAYRLNELNRSNLLFDLPIQPFMGTSLLDCTLIDCRAPNGFTIGSAFDAGALRAVTYDSSRVVTLDRPATLGDIQPGLSGLTVADLVGANPAFTAAALGTFMAANTTTLAQAEQTPGLQLQGIPIQLLDTYRTVTIKDARLLFSGWRLIDFGGLADGLERGDIERAVANWNGARAASGTPVKLGDLTRQVRLDDVDGIGNDLYVDTLALSTVAKAAPALTVDDVWPRLQPLRVEHLRLVGATASPAIVGAARAKTIGQVRDASPALPVAQPLQGLLWGDIIGSTKTKPLPSAAGITIASVLGNFRGVTLGEFLRAAQPISDQDPSALDLGAVNLADYSTGTGTQMSVGFRLDGTTRPDGVRLVTTLPAGSRYVDGSAQLQGGPSLVGLEPTTFGDTLVWLVTNVQPAVDYTIRFGVRAPAQTGTVTASVSGQLQRRNVFASASTVIDYREAFEPNDRPADLAIQTIGPDQIFLSQISTATDVDLYRFEVTTSGTRIGAVLSNLPADYDLTIVGPSEPSAATTGGRVLESVGDSQLGVTGGKTAATLADAGQYQPPAGSNLGVIARSTGRGTATERIDQIPVTRLGTYYLVVTGYDGVSSGKSYALQLQSDAPTLLPAVCPPNGVTFPFAGAGTNAVSDVPAGTNTLFVINNARFGNQYGAGPAADVLAAINTLRTQLRPGGSLAGLGLVPGVLDLGTDAAVTSANTAWDAEPCKLDRANGVVAATSSALAAVYRTNPGIKNVVMVGSDKIIPFARLSDRTLLGNEQNYAQTFTTDRSTALYAALIAGTFFSDDPYVDTTPTLVNDRALYAPERAIGRLVEDPASIIGQLTSFAQQQGKIRTNSGLVTGYDFVADSSSDIADRLDADRIAGRAATTDTFTGPLQVGPVKLINDTWTANDLRALWFPATGPTAGIGSVNGHFSHQGTQSAAGSASGNQGDALFVGDVGATDFKGSLIFTLGCHSGLSVSEDVSSSLRTDWAETFARAGAGAYIAQSGFGYGSSDSVQLSESLLVGFSERLDGNYTIGDALRLAKNDYLGRVAAGSISVYDEKASQQAILFGLPFSTPAVASPPSRPVAPPPIAVAPTPVPGLSSGAAVVDVDFQSRSTDRGTVYEISGRSYAPAEFPLQPITTVDATAPDANGDRVPDQRLHGALLRSGVAYTVPGLIDPVYQTPTINGPTREPELQPADAVFPISPLAISSADTEFGSRDYVVAQPGRFTATQPDGKGTQALYDDLRVQTLHSVSDDWVAPTIGSVNQTVGNGALAVSVTTPSADVAGVVVAVVENLPGATQAAPVPWRTFNLQPSGPGRWGGAVALAACSANLEYLVQIYDTAGNVRVMSNKAAGFTTPCSGTADPSLTTTVGLTNLDLSGWYAGPVTVTVRSELTNLKYSIDGGGFVPLPASKTFPITGDGIRTFVVSDPSGAVTSAGTVKIDASAPTITINTPTGDVIQGATFTVGFSCQDPTLVSCTATLTSPSGSTVIVIPGQVTVAGGSGGYTLTVTADDAVSTTGPATASKTFTVDSTAPVVTCPSSPTYTLNQTGATITATVSDGGSGPTAPTVTAPAPTGIVGARTVGLQATDRAGNTSVTKWCGYSVGYRFDGFQSPLSNTAVNNVNAGSNVPVKWRITDANGVGVADPVSFVVLRLIGSPCAATATVTVTEVPISTGSDLKYQGNGIWQYNWKTPRSPTGCFDLQLVLNDSVTPRIVEVRLR